MPPALFINTPHTPHTPSPTPDTSPQFPSGSQRGLDQVEAVSSQTLPAEDAASLRPGLALVTPALLSVLTLQDQLYPTVCDPMD